VNFSLLLNLLKIIVIDFVVQTYKQVFSKFYIVYLHAKLSPKELYRFQKGLSFYRKLYFGPQVYQLIY